MKRLVSVLLITCLAITLLVGCGQSPTPSDEGEGEPDAQEEKQITIGFSFPTLQEERWQTEKDLAEEKSKELGANFIYQDANTDATTQNSQIENLITQGIDVLIIGAADTKAAATGVAAAQEAGIPVIAYLRMVDSDKLDCFVGYDFVRIGEIMAEAALESVPKGNYVLLNGSEADSVAHQLREGYHNILDAKVDSGDINVIFDQFVLNWEPANAMSDMENCLTQNNNDVQAVLVNNDGMAGGAIQALGAQNLIGEVFVTGMDGDLAACQRIVEGKQNTTIVFQHDKLIDATMEAAMELAQGKQPAGINEEVENALTMVPAILLAADLVHKDNVKELMIDSGIHKLEDVYKNIPEDQWPEN